MKNWKIYFYSWLPNEENGNPKFWTFDLLPSLGINSGGKRCTNIYLNWLFWTIELNNFENE